MIRIIKDQRENVASQGLFLNRWEHQVLKDGPWVRAMRVVCRNPRLFVYFHRRRLVFVVAEWRHEPKYVGDIAVCAELDTMSGPPDQHPPDRPSPDAMKKSCMPLWFHMEELDNNDKSELNKEQQLKGASLEERTGQVKLLKKKGYEEEARLLATSPYVGNEEGGDQVKELRDVIRSGRRTVSHA